MRTSLAIAFALLTALANAVGLVSQHRASTGAPGRGWALVAHLARQPLWLLGWAAMAGSLVGQALALHFGTLSLVQPLLVTELAFALVLRRVSFGQHLRPAAWGAAGLTILALSGFLTALAPRASAAVPTPSRWVVASAAVAAGAGVSALLARRGRPVRRAAGFAIATALLWALEAAFIRAATAELASRGVSGLVTTWPLYAMIACGVLGILGEQAALHVGPLQVSQPLIVIVDPLASVALGIGLEHDQLRHGTVAVVLAAVAFLAVAAGVVRLTRVVPDHLGPVERLAATPPGGLSASSPPDVA